MKTLPQDPNNPTTEAAPAFDREKTIRQIMEKLWKFATDDEVKSAAKLLSIGKDQRGEDEPGCTHTEAVCKCCGKEGSPAQLMASRPRKRSPGAAEQSRQAVKKGMERKAAKGSTTP